MSRAEELETCLLPTILGMGYQLWGIEYLVFGKRPKLCVYIDAEQGVTVDDCEKVSDQVNTVLDVEGAMPEDYVLEVSSPGLDRILFKPKQFEASVGEQLDVRLHSPIEGARKYRGRLVECKNRQIQMEANGSSIEIPLRQIRRARIIPQFV